MERIRIASALKHIGWIVVLVFVTAFVVHFSWNMVIPDLFGAKALGYKDAMGLVALVATLSWLVAFSFGASRRHAGNKHLPRSDGVSRACGYRS
jgi:hypothetical protein